MAGKKWLKLVRGLHQKKYRNEHQLFFVEGKKTIEELLNAGFKPAKILAYPDLIIAYANFPTEEITPNELKSVSALKNPNGVLGVFEMPKKQSIDDKDWLVALDDVRDPGNLGTIIRLCDWFGFSTILCSSNTVDCYNPKVLQATMGSIARINIVYCELSGFLESSEMPVYGAFMNGTSVYGVGLPKSGILLLGNEANGIAEGLTPFIDQRIAIPQFGKETAESLNVAMAAGVLLSEIRRKG